MQDVLCSLLVCLCFGTLPYAPVFRVLLQNMNEMWRECGAPYNRVRHIYITQLELQPLAR